MLQRLRQREQCKLAYKLPSAANLLQRYAFLLKDARNYWKIFKAEEDKKKKGYPRLPDVWARRIHLIIYYFKRNMTGISTEPETTLPSPSGTKRGISLTTLKASLSNRGSSLVFYYQIIPYVPPILKD